MSVLERAEKYAQAVLYVFLIVNVLKIFGPTLNESFPFTFACELILVLRSLVLSEQHFS